MLPNLASLVLMGAPRMMIWDICEGVSEEMPSPVRVVLRVVGAFDASVRGRWVIVPVLSCIHVLKPSAGLQLDLAGCIR